MGGLLCASHGGGWRVRVDRRSGTPTLAREGPGVEWLPPEQAAAVSVDELEAMARAFVLDTGGLLKIDEQELFLNHEGSGRRLTIPPGGHSACGER